METLGESTPKSTTQWALDASSAARALSPTIAPAIDVDSAAGTPNPSPMAAAPAGGDTTAAPHEHQAKSLVNMRARKTRTRKPRYLGLGECDPKDQLDERRANRRRLAQVAEAAEAAQAGRPYVIEPCPLAAGNYPDPRHLEHVWTDAPATPRGRPPVAGRPAPVSLTKLCPGTAGRANGAA